MIYDKYFKENGSKLLEEIFFSEQYDDEYGEDYYPKHQIAFYFQENDKYIAVDNRDGECYVEEFNTNEEAINWIKEC